jgi:hydroxymethylpyrimidine pyrophosphatase-like HAD family hydrolase
MDLKDWIATDLDNTLFHRSWGGEDSVAATWHPAAEGEDRVPSSWIRGSTHRLMEALGRSFALVPVTARDMDSFSRVNVAGLNLGGPAVVANGALILGADGTPDAAWEKRMTDLLSPWEAELNGMCEWLVARSTGRARPRLVTGPGGLPAYLVAKAEEGWWNSTEGKAVLGDRDWAGCKVAVLGTELQVLPPGVGKQEAVTEVRDRFFGGRPPLMCMGDMPQDLQFMCLGGLMAMPVGSVLEQSLT